MTCLNDLDPTHTDTMLIDVEESAPVTGFYYLVTAREVSGEEGTLGDASCMERSNFRPALVFGVHLRSPIRHP